MTNKLQRLPCPCGRTSGKRILSYADCCGRYIEDFLPAHKAAPDPESLMRSRYAAFVLERSDYLMFTWDPAFRPGTLDFDPGIKWLGLDIRSTSLRDPQHGEVEFVARSRQNGRGIRLHERSRFIRRDGRWLYTDGDMLE